MLMYIKITLTSNECIFKNEYYRNGKASVLNM